MSRSSDIVYQMQHRRAERKKPKFNAKLKRVNISDNQKGGIAAANENKPPPITMQKTAGRNSFALFSSIGFHVVLALIFGILVIKDRITLDDENTYAAFVPPDITLRERGNIKARPRPTFDAKEQVIDAPIKQTPVTNANLPPSQGGFILPTDTNTDLAPVGPALDAGPRIGEIGRGLAGPIQPISPTTVSPSIVRPTQKGGPIADLNSDLLEGAENSTLEVPEIDLTQPGSSNPKAKYVPKPAYPKNARRAQKEGTVKLRATIGTNGIPKNIVALTKLGFGFEEAAIAAWKKSKYIPAKKNGKDIEVTVKIKFEFKLDDY